MACIDPEVKRSAYKVTECYSFSGSVWVCMSIWLHLVVVDDVAESVEETSGEGSEAASLSYSLDDCTELLWGNRGLLERE